MMCTSQRNQSVLSPCQQSHVYSSLNSALTVNPNPQPTFPSITAWEKDGLRVAFDFSKPPGQPAVTDITATYTTASGAVSDFTLQVRRAQSRRANAVLNVE